MLQQNGPSQFQYGYHTFVWLNASLKYRGDEETTSNRKNNNKKVTLLNTILLIPNPRSEALIPKISFVNCLLPPDYS